ncbi:MAG: hypothetical protein QXT84_02045 [Candidatus Bathyarchaeia archaeon]
MIGLNRDWPSCGPKTIREEGTMKKKVQGIACRFTDAVPVIYFKRGSQWRGGYVLTNQERLRNIIQVGLNQCFSGEGHIFPTEWGWVITFK